MRSFVVAEPTPWFFVYFFI